MWYWLSIAGMGLITFAIRVSLIALAARTDIPPAVRRSLRFVPPAVLMALAAPAFVRPEGPINLSFTNAYLVAGALAALIAWKSQHTLLTIGAGLTILWVLSAAFR